MKHESSAPTGPVPNNALVTVIAVVSAAITLPFGESVIGIQLAAIGRSFDAHGALLSWVVNAYMLTFATSILVAGLAADRLGRRRLFAIGLGLVGIANTLAIVAPSLASLIGLRAVAGLGAGTLLASGPALLAARFPEPGPARARAFAAFGSAAGSGIAFGPLVGGLIMDWNGWRAVFAVYLPFVAIAALLLPRIAPSHDSSAPRIDGWGVVLFTAVLAILIWAIEGAGSTPGSRMLLGAIACVLAIVLIGIECRHAHPAIDPTFFMNPVFGVMSLTMVCWQIGVAVSMVYVPAVVVTGLGASPGLAGASILPMAIMLFLATPLGPWLVGRIGTRGFIAACIGAMIVGDEIIFATLTASETVSTAGLIAGLALIGLGGGAANGSMDNLAMGTISTARAGQAAGVFQTVRIGSAALAVASAGSALSISQTAPSNATGTLGDVTGRYAMLAGVGALLMSVLAVASITVLRSARSSHYKSR